VTEFELVLGVSVLELPQSVVAWPASFLDSSQAAQITKVWHPAVGERQLVMESSLVTEEQLALAAMVEKKEIVPQAQRLYQKEPAE
jgi:hypothetical protein